MAISPLEQLGSIGRTQDFSVIKQQEDAKEYAQQTVLQTQVDKHAEERLTQVSKTDRSEMAEKKFDAKEKGDNQYYGDGGRRRKQSKETDLDGKVMLKGHGSFDIKI